MIRFFSRKFIFSSIRFVSSKTNTSPNSNAILRYSWFETISDVDPNERSSVSQLPSSTFNRHLLNLLSDSIRKPLSPKVADHILKTFEHWSGKEFYDLMITLGAYGMQPIDVLYLLVELPSADKTIVTVENLKRTFENLIEMRFDATTRSILLSNDPNLIQYDKSYIRERLDVLLTYFTFREVRKLVRTHRKLFTEPWIDLDYKVNFLKIVLFASTRDIVESGALSLPIDEIRRRTVFAFRTGVYKRVRREELYLEQRRTNISFVDLFQTSRKSFVEKVTNNLLRVEDFQAFVDSLGSESFEDELTKYLTLDKLRTKWNSYQRLIERNERRQWISEFDAYNLPEIDDLIDEEDKDETDSSNQTKLVVHQERNASSWEGKPSEWHPLSDWNPDRHRRKKFRLKTDPNLRY